MALDEAFERANKKTDKCARDTLKTWLNADRAQRKVLFFEYEKVFLTEENKKRKSIATQAVSSEALLILDQEADRLLSLRQRRHTAQVLHATRALFIVAQAFITLYEQKKAQQNVVDYDDLISKTATVFHNRTDVLYQISDTIDHILLDEAQDTSLEQWKVIHILVHALLTHAAPKAVFPTVCVVGDIKQSIYSFQDVTPNQFLSMRNVFRDLVSQSRWREVDLDVSFRSTVNVLRFVDEVCTNPEMKDGFLLSEKQSLCHIPVRRTAFGYTAVQSLPITQNNVENPNPSPDNPWRLPILSDDQTTILETAHTHIADHVARTIRDLLDKRICLKERPDVRPGDILILIPKRDKKVHTLIQTLKKYHIPTSGIDKMQLTEHIAIKDLIALGEFILLNENDLALAEVLKGPLIGMDEDTLLALAHKRQTSLWQALKQQAFKQRREDHHPLMQFMGCIYTYLQHLKTHPTPYAFFSAVLELPCPADERSGRRAIVSRLGFESTEFLEEFLFVCLRFENQYTPSLQYFLSWLMTHEDFSVKRRIEHNTQRIDVVRIMTIHGAKGLQAPIVFLPYASFKPVSLFLQSSFLWRKDDLPLLILDKKIMDSVCAEDVNREQHNIHQEYYRLFYVAITRAQDYLYIYGEESGKHNKTPSWYSIARCSQDKITHEIEPKPISTQMHRESEVQPQLPSWVWCKVVQEQQVQNKIYPSQSEDNDVSILGPFAKGDIVRYRRGLLIHKLFEILPTSQRPEEEARIFLDRYASDLTESVKESLLRNFLNVLQDPTFAILFGPKSYAEISLMGRVQGYTVSGKVDRLVFAEDCIWIADYKTHQRPPETEQDVSISYIKQMALYQAILRQMYPKKLCYCALIWTEKPLFMKLSQSLLTQHIESLTPNDRSENFLPTTITAQNKTLYHEEYQHHFGL